MLSRQTVAVGVLLTGFGGLVAAAGVKPVTRGVAASRAPAVATVHSTATRVYQMAPFRSNVPVLSYYHGVPLVPGTITGAQTQALINAGIAPPYHQVVGLGRTIPLPGASLNQFRQRERFLNTLLAGENRLLSVQTKDVLAAARLMQGLARLSHLIPGLPPRQMVVYSRLFGVLSNQLRRLNITIAANNRGLLVGLRNELLVFRLLNPVAPFSPDVAFYRLMILEQRRLADFLLHQTETPFVVPPIVRRL